MAKIGNPKDLNGNALLTGIKVSSGNALLGSNFTTIKNGSNVTLTSNATGVLVINANDSGKVSKPSTNGTAGQVLKTSGNGGTYWGDAGLASVGWSEISDIPVVVSALPSTSGASGQVLKAGTNGTITWVNAVNSAIYATSAGGVTAGNVYGIVSSASFATKTSSAYAVAGTSVVGIVSSATYATKAGKVDDLDTHISNTAIHVPSTAGKDAGSVLKIVGGVPEWGVDLTADGSAVLPGYGSTDDGKFLQVMSNGTATGWVTAATGNMHTSEYVNGNGVVKSATYATSTGKVAAGGVYGVVSSATHATSAGGVAAGNVYGIVSSATYATSTGKIAAGGVYGIVSSATYATSAGGVAADNVKGVVSSATYATSAGGVAAGNVKGVVSSASYATTAGTATTATTMTGIDGYVQKNTTINGKNLSNSVTLTGADIKIDTATGASTISAKINALETSVGNKGNGDMITSIYVSASGTGVVKSATYATSTGKVAAGGVYGVVSSATYATSAGGVSATNVYGIVSSATYAGTAGTMTGIDSYVKKSTTINGKNLSNNISLTGVDFKVDTATNAVTISAKLSALENSIANNGNGDMITSIYVSASGTGVVKSATYATSTGKIAAGGVYGVVSSATYATSAGGVAADNVKGIVSSASYATSTGKVAAGGVYGIVSSATYATSAGGVAAGNVKGVVSSATYATKAGKVDDLDTHISNSLIHVPSTAGYDNGKVLKIVNGVPEWGVDLTADGSAVLPGYSSTDNGKFLQVVSNGTATEWVTAATGNMHTSDYVNGNSVVKSASYAGYATSAGKVAAGGVYGVVSSATYATSAGGVTAGNVYGIVSSATYATSTGKVAAGNVYGVVSSATYAGTAGTITGIDSYVKKSTTINGQNLSNNISLTGVDIKIDTATGASTISAKINALETSVGNKGNGDMITSIYVSASGTGVVKSATYATSTGKVAAGNVYGIVSSATYATSTGNVAAGNVYGIVSSATYATSAGGVAAGNVKGVVSSATYATTAGGVYNSTVTIYAGTADTTNKAGSFTLNQNANSNITVPLATTGKFGVIKVGNGLAITNGVLSATAQTVTVSNAVASNGTTAVAGSAIYSFVENRLNSKVEYEDIAKVAFTGNYNDLSNKPTIGGGGGTSGFTVSGSTVVSMVGGTNVTLSVNNSTVTIAAAGGGGGSVTVDGTITQNGTNPVAGSAIWSAINYLANQIASL